jgi:predicted dehydrogenase
MMLRHRSGAVSVVEVSYGARGLPDAFPATILEIEGDRGAIRMGADYQIHITSDGKLTHLDGDAPLLPWAERPWHVTQESVLNTCRHILERFRAGQSADVSGADNLRTYALCDAAYNAAASRRAEKPTA